MAYDPERLRTLLEANHSFPCTYGFKAVTRPASVSTVLTAVTAAAGETLTVEDVTKQESRNGNWVSLRIKAHVSDADTVLRIYDVLGQMEEVVLTL